MARISPKDFIGTRSRMHRMRDAKVFNGWIQNMYGDRVDVLMHADSLIQIGDKLRFELHGRKTSAVFEAKLARVDQFDFNTGGAIYGIDGTSARVIEAEWVSLQFNVVGPFRYANALQAFGAEVKGMQAQLSIDGKESSGTVVDVGQVGFGIVLDEAVIPGSKFKFRVDTPVGLVTGDALVRNCKRDKEGKFRAGVQLLDMGRLDRPRWNRFVEES